MTTAKVALSIPEELLREAKKEVSRRAKSLSAFVSEALDEKLRRNALSDLLDEMDETHGAPTKADQQWAKRVLKR